MATGKLLYIHKNLVLKDSKPNNYENEPFNVENAIDETIAEFLFHIVVLLSFRITGCQILLP